MSDEFPEFIRRGDQLYVFDAFQTIIEVLSDDFRDNIPPVPVPNNVTAVQRSYGDLEDMISQRSYDNFMEEYPAYATLPTGAGTLKKFYSDTKSTLDGKIHSYHFLDDRNQYYVAFRVVNNELDRLLISQYPVLISNEVVNIAPGLFVLESSGNLGIVEIISAKAIIRYFNSEIKFRRISPQGDECIYAFDNQDRVYLIRSALKQKYFPSLAVGSQYGSIESPLFLESGDAQYFINELRELEPCIQAVSNQDCDFLLTSDGEVIMLGCNFYLPAVLRLRVTGIVAIKAIANLAVLMEDDQGEIFLAVRQNSTSMPVLVQVLSWGEGWTLST